MPKELNLKLNLIPYKLDRSITSNILIHGKPITFSILHNKRSPHIKFQLYQNSEPLKKGIVTVSMHRNLDTCKFCKIFFNLETRISDNIDYQNKFNGINRMYDRELFQFMKEKLDFNIPEHKKSSVNYLLLLGYKVHAHEDDLIYLFIQRRFFNVITRMAVLRTSGIQFSTKRGLEVMERYYNNYQDNVKISSELSFLDKDI